MTTQLIGVEARGAQALSASAFGGAPASVAVDGNTRLRITQRGRMVIAVLIILPLLAAGLIWGSTTALATSAPAADSFEYVTVQQGDTLWGIVADFPRAQDPRDSVADFISLNNLETAELQPGQRLAVPSALSVAEDAAAS